RRRVDAEWNRRYDHEAGGHRGEGQRHRQARGDQRGHGDVVLDRAAEVAGGGAADPVEVLDEDGAVETERDADPRRRLRAALGAHMMSAGSPGSTRTTTKTSTDTKTRVARSAATLRPRYRRNSGGAGYFCQATSERSKAGSGRSFQRPVSPFLV